MNFDFDFDVKWTLISRAAYLVRDILSVHKKVAFNKAKINFTGLNIYIADISSAERDLNSPLTLSLHESSSQFLEN